MSQKVAVIIGAGPAGLTAAYELIDKTNIKPIIFETTESTGGISKTVNYKGNRIDIGGHRFFSKSDRIMQWWQNILPLQGEPAKDDKQLGRKVLLVKQSVKRKVGSQNLEHFNPPDPEKTDKVMLSRSRLSRIFFLRKFFDYPVSLNYDTLSNLGIKRTFKIGFSYIKSYLNQIKPEKSLEDFFINRFGEELYRTFFKDYTEKVWGVSCSEIKSDWRAQRVKGLSIKKTIFHAISKNFSRNSSFSQKKLETSLISQFMYPKLGPGQMWEEVAKIITKNGGEIHYGSQLIGIKNKDQYIKSVQVEEKSTGVVKSVNADYFISTMPVKDLINSFNGDIPVEVQKVAKGLMYRDFITVGLLLKKLKIKNKTKIKTLHNLIPDNWIYIQERDVKLGRLQIFNNWSPYMVKDENNVWIGLEYFCNEGDELWNMDDEKLTDFAVNELTSIDIINKKDVIDSVIIRMPKTYLAYFGTYDRFSIIREFTDGFKNLFLVGRNGMHRYNNMDHSMLTAMTAVENICEGITSKDNIWMINAEEDYHEE
ncbi:NAD(P)/FAD-dependent oxidoreductase [Methanobacterium sp. MZD130B]|jgi:protoporphyrinogen oxidase|uniref:NAD(P)/FAD-dependent oxidoreductase n=1 Tax=Methanobacterium sp. MZD130B TaxID=3394378 RepID=UPI0039FCF9F8